MNAAILCPGPSLASLSTVPAADLVIGVNRAALRFACTDWCCCDLPAIEQWHESVIDGQRGAPTLISGMEAVDNLRDRKVIWRGEVFDRRRMLDYCPHEINWVMFSFTTAIVYAGYREAKRIDIYGCDWKGTADFDGAEAGKNRSDERWELERAIVARRLVPWLAERGVEVAFN